MMFSLGQHKDLATASPRLLSGEKVFAFLDEYLVCPPHRVGAVFRAFGGGVVDARPHQLAPRENQDLE